ncbi:MAG: type II toxin-antitoxin system prevent-host-death family antitoxin [Thermoanaerobaculia bacterium]
MTWKIAQAKQNFSQVIRAAAEAPQFIHNRSQPVAAVISGETFALFEAWLREQKRRRPLSEAFSELRALCAEEDYAFPEVIRRDRRNPFADSKAEEA